MGAHVTILDISLDRLRYLDDVLPANVDTAYSNRHNILDAIRRADLVIGAVLLPGAKAPHLVKRDDLKPMKPGSVIVDVAVDQGGCVETIKPTTHENPTYFVDGILHYGVANMPGGVPRTSTLALTNATLPYGLKLAKHGWRPPARTIRPFGSGSTWSRARWSTRVAEAFELPLDRRRRRPLSRSQMPESDARLPHGEGLPLPDARHARRRPGTTWRARRTACLAPMERRLFRTGFAIAMPAGFECQVRPRSGLALKHGVTLPNTPATIDSDYRGELMVALINLGAEPFAITRGMRIAQLVIARVEPADVRRRWTPAGHRSRGRRIRQHGSVDRCSLGTSRSRLNDTARVHLPHPRGTFSL